MTEDDRPATDTWTGLDLIADERRRQVEVEGYTREWDAQYTEWELGLAAQCYVMECVQPGEGDAFWPWDADDWHPSDPIRNLVKAGALIAAEVDRLLARRTNDEES